MLPESDRVLYKKNPLVEVICQLRFPTILRIREGHLADFQDRIRKDYPIYTLQEPSIDIPQLPKELATMLERVNIAIPGGQSVHKFSTADSTRFISLSQDFLAVAEINYERWETFRAEIERAERSLREIYDPAFYSRVGLRYRNVISRQLLGIADVAWQDLLQPHITAELGDKALSSSVVKTQTSAIIRIPEIAGAQIMLIHGLTKQQGSEENCYGIDADFSIARKEGIHEPFELLDKFNRLAGRLFSWAITKKLHNAMEPRPI